MSVPDTQSPENVVDVIERKEWPGQIKKSKVIAQRITKTDERNIEDLNKKGRVWIEKDDRFTVKAKQYIGSVDFDGGFKLNVIPKIFQHDKDKNKKTAAVINFANGLKSEDIMNDLNNYYENDMEPLLEDLQHLQLVRDTEYLLRRGLLRSYVVHMENMTSLRGKLLLQCQMLNDATQNPKFFCEYDELEYDNTENRTILQALTVVRRAKRQNVAIDAQQRKWRDEIKIRANRSAERFLEVVQKEEVSRPERL